MLTYKIQGLNADPNFFAHNLFLHISIEIIVPYANPCKEKHKKYKKNRLF